MKRIAIAVLTIAFVLGGCTAHTDCRTSATTPQAKRSCSYTLAANQLEASKATLLQLLESASYANAKGMISDDQFVVFRAACSKASEAHNAAVTGLSLAVQADTDPWGLLMNAGPAFDELFRLAALLEIR